LIVTVAAGPYAHLAGLAAASDDGLELRCETLEPGHIFPRMQRDAAWDVAEMSLATAYIMADRGEQRFVALPVFPSRAFRHSSLYVPAASPVRGAGELRGRRIGVLRYAMTTAVWVRAMLADPYGVPAQGLQWVVGDESPHPAGVTPQKVEGAAALERMAAAGELDCLISGRTPAAFHDGRLRRLFPDFGAEEKAYYARTRVFPIMHVMVATRALLERRPGVVAKLIKRFAAAKHAAEEGLLNFDISMYPLPWLPAYVEDARRQVGGDLWPYGIELNRATLTAFAQALVADGLIGRARTPEEVFVDA
jgi:4,5-dihydroxyphthalate decarboxylase